MICTSEVKQLINTLLYDETENVNFQLKWELRKYEISKFTIAYAKDRAKERKNSHNTWRLSYKSRKSILIIVIT